LRTVIITSDTGSEEALMARILSLPVVAMAAGLLAACGGPAFDGTFEGSYQGQPARLVLSAEGKTVTGTLSWGGAESQVLATADGKVALGTARHAASGGEFSIVARLAEGGLDCTFEGTDPYTGLAQKFDVSFARRDEGGGGGEPQAGGTVAAGVDPRIVGRWYCEVGGTSISGNTVTTRIRCAFSADGTFEYGGAESLISLRPYPGGPGATGGTGAAGTTRGQWKCEGDVLSARADASAPWTPLGGVTFSGSDLLVTTPDGAKQLWSRE
jgi:hypothetical protein